MSLKVSLYERGSAHRIAHIGQGRTSHHLFPHPPSGPGKSVVNEDDMLCQLLDKELDADALLVHSSTTSLTCPVSRPYHLSPLKKAQRSSGSWDGLNIKPAMVNVYRMEVDSPPSSTQHDSAK